MYYRANKDFGTLEISNSTDKKFKNTVFVSMLQYITKFSFFYIYFYIYGYIINFGFIIINLF